MTWRITACAAVSCLPCVAQDRVLRLHDLRGIEEACVEDPGGVDARPILDMSVLDQLEPESTGIRAEDAFEASSLDWHALLESCRELDPGLRLDERSGALELEATARAQVEAERVIGIVEQELRRSVRVEFLQIASATLPADAGAVLSAAEVSGLLQAVEVSQASRAVGRLGRPMSVGSAKIGALVQDFDVANYGALVALDPQVSFTRSGTEVGALVREVADGRLFLRAWGRGGALRDARRVLLHATDETTVALPRAAFAVGFGSALVEDGGGLLLHQPDWTWLVRATLAGPPRRRDFVPLGLLTARPLIRRPYPLTGPSPSGGWAWTDFESPESWWEPLFDAQELCALVRERGLTAGLGEGVHVIGSALWVPRSDELERRARGLLFGLQRALARTVEVEVRYGLVAREQGEAVVRGARDARELELDRRCIGACRVGDALTLLGGEELFYLNDFDIEISMGGAHPPDPIVATLRTGARLLCRPTSMRDGRVATSVSFGVHELLGELEQERVVLREAATFAGKELGTYTGAIELPTTTRAGIHTQLALESGAWHELCVENLPGTEHYLVACIRVSPQ